MWGKSALKVQEDQRNVRQLKLNGVHWGRQPVLNELEWSAVAVRGRWDHSRQKAQQMQRHWDTTVIRGVRRQPKGQRVCKGRRARAVKASLLESHPDSSCWQSKVSGEFKLSRFSVLKLGTQLPREPPKIHRLDEFYKWREMHQFLTPVAKCELKIVHSLSIRLCSIAFFFFFLCVTFLSKISEFLKAGIPVVTVIRRKSQEESTWNRK